MIVSIIVPVYNVKGYLKRCLDSLTQQTYEKIEILLIDDGSSDGSGAICDSYAEKHENVKVVHKNNGGVSSARNLGLEKASGDYILFVDSDDWIERDAVENLVNVAVENNSDIVIFEYFVDTAQTSTPNVHVHLEGCMTNEEALYHTIMPTNRFAWSKMYKKSAVQDVEFDKNIHLGEDTLFACSAIAKAESVYFLAKPLKASAYSFAPAFIYYKPNAFFQFESKP